MLHHGLQYRASVSPGSLALKLGTVEYSYGQLNSIANCAARELLDRIGQRDSLIAILSPDPALQLAVTFAVWKAGMTALILDPNEPQKRLKQIIDDSGANLLVTDKALSGSASRLSGDPMIFELSRSDPDADDVDVARDPQHAAVLVYTSGSTGRPKGVIRTHGNFLVEVRHDTAFSGIDDTDRVSLMLPLNFGFGLKCSLRALLSGSALCSYDPLTEGLVPFADWLCKDEITVLIPPVSYFRTFLGTVTSGVEPRACKCVILSGESFYKADVDNFRRVFGSSCKLVRSYGSTETGTVACFDIARQRPSLTLYRQAIRWVT